MIDDEELAREWRRFWAALAITYGGTILVGGLLWLAVTREPPKPAPRDVSECTALSDGGYACKPTEPTNAGYTP